LREPQTFDLGSGAAYPAPAMAPIASATPFHIALAIHVATIITTFGVIFARPLVFAVAGRGDPHALPVLHRIEYTVERWVVTPGVLVVVLSGSYLVQKGGNWGAFYVWWGIGVAVLMGAALGTVMIPTARRAEAVARRDLSGMGADASGGGSVGGGALSVEYRALTRRLALVGGVLGLLVLITMLFMGLERPY
jgi:hypothetical protein